MRNHSEDSVAITMPTQMSLLIAALCVSASVQPGAADGHLMPGAKWRECDEKGFAPNVMYYKGSDAGDYVPGWATDAGATDLLNKGADLEAACSELLEEGQVGEIYVMSNATEGAGCDGGCYRMAVYPSTQEQQVDPQKWYYLKKSRGVPVQCGADNGVPNGKLLCAGNSGGGCQWSKYGTNWTAFQEMTGVTSSVYKDINCPGWPADDGSDACEELSCYAPKDVGVVEGDDGNWVCGKSAPPPRCPGVVTCGEIKEAYKTTSECCGMPQKKFTLPDQDDRRLSGLGKSESDAFLDDLTQALDQAKARRPAEARALAQRMQNVVEAGERFYLA